MKTREFLLLAAVAALALPVEAAACTLRPFKVYFPTGDPSFPTTEEARDQVRWFHRYVTSGDDHSTILVAHTDRVGTPEEQMERSRLMALAVASELEAAGLPRSGMTVQWKGSSQMVRPTAQGEAEPLNRRVEMFSVRPVDPDSACLHSLPPPGTSNE
jgi:outer membrane protein OmpA-like peptidoglycan-associated protein